jgi:hypothetical protein
VLRLGAAAALPANLPGAVIKDVVMLGSYQEAEIDFTADNPGRTLFHCHQQLHMLGFAASGWFSIVAPAGTPPATIATLNRVMTAYLARPDVAEELASLAMRPLTSTPEELGRFIASERAKWAEIAAEAGLTPQ